jgi:hypothetical protein
MDDNPRNRLQMFIGKFSDEMQQAMLQSKPTPAAGKQLSSYSLIKWDNKNNERIINKARKLIFVAHNARQYPDKTATELLSNFDDLYSAIKSAEQILYALPDRHLETLEVQEKPLACNWLRRLFSTVCPRCLTLLRVGELYRSKPLVWVAVAMATTSTLLLILSKRESGVSTEIWQIYYLYQSRIYTTIWRRDF